MDFKREAQRTLPYIRRGAEALINGLEEVFDTEDPRRIVECLTIARETLDKLLAASVRHKAMTEVMDASVRHKAMTEVMDASVRHKAMTEVMDASVCNTFDNCPIADFGVDWLKRDIPPPPRRRRPKRASERPPH